MLCLTMFVLLFAAVMLKNAHRKLLGNSDAYVETMKHTCIKIAALRKMLILLFVPNLNECIYEMRTAKLC